MGILLEAVEGLQGEGLVARAKAVVKQESRGHVLLQPKYKFLYNLVKMSSLYFFCLLCKPLSSDLPSSPFPSVLIKMNLPHLMCYFFHLSHVTNSRNIFSIEAQTPEVPSIEVAWEEGWDARQKSLELIPLVCFVTLSSHLQCGFNLKYQNSLKMQLFKKKKNYI